MKASMTLYLASMLTLGVAFAPRQTAFRSAASLSTLSVTSPKLFQSVKGNEYATTLEKTSMEVNDALDTKSVSKVDVEVYNENKKEELSETQRLMKQVKDGGVAGIISYALWELGFWAVSIPVVVFGYYEVVGHMPNFSNSEDVAKLSAEAFAFVNFARFAVPLRIGLALSTTPWIETNIVQRFLNKKDDESDPEAKVDEA